MCIALERARLMIKRKLESRQRAVRSEDIVENDLIEIDRVTTKQSDSERRR